MSHNQLLILYLPITACMPALLSWYVGRQLLGSAAPSTPGAARAAAAMRARGARGCGIKPALWATIVGMFLLGLAACLALVFWNEQDCVPLIRPLIAAGFTVLATLLTTAALLLVRDVTRGISWIVTRWRAGHGVEPTHSSGRNARWLHRSSWAILLIAIGCVVAGQSVAARPPAVRHVKVALRGLPSSFGGFRVAHLTDIHIHGRTDRERIRALVAQVNALHVDLIAITGDVVDGALDDLRAELAPLGELHATYGIYAAVGNHEYYADVDACVREFRRLGQTVLLNEHRVVRKGSEAIVIAGVTNPQRGMHGSRFSSVQGEVARMTSSPAQALAGAPADVPHILLAHQPRSVAEARGLGVDLALVGHSHGGQFFPWNLAAGLVYPYATGLSRDGSMQVYVSRGIGTFGPATRLGSPPEITVIELVPGSSATR